MVPRPRRSGSPVGKADETVGFGRRRPVGDLVGLRLEHSGANGNTRRLHGPPPGELGVRMQVRGVKSQATAARHRGLTRQGGS